MAIILIFTQTSGNYARNEGKQIKQQRPISRFLGNTLCPLRNWLRNWLQPTKATATKRISAIVVVPLVWKAKRINAFITVFSIALIMSLLCSAKL